MQLDDAIGQNVGLIGMPEHPRVIGMVGLRKYEYDAFYLLGLPRQLEPRQQESHRLVIDHPYEVETLAEGSKDVLVALLLTAE